MRLVKYLAAGAINTLAGLSVIFFAKRALGMDDVAANLLGYSVGVVVSFSVNRNWTFQDDSNPLEALARYLLVVLIAYACNLMTVLLAIDTLRIDSYVAQALGVIPYIAVGYLGSRFFAFAPRR